MDSMLRWFFAVATALLAVAVLSSCTGAPLYEPAAMDGGVFGVEVASLREDEPVFHTLVHEGRNINFFVLKTGGEVQSFFDACARCYPKKRGYRADGRELVCQACGVRYPMSGLKGLGGCYPIELKGEVSGGKYIVKREEILMGWKYF